MKRNRKIVCVHLLNDFSGSPRILSQVIKAFIEEGNKVDLYTSKSETGGFLSGIPGAVNHEFLYRWSRYKMFTLVYFLFSQVVLFFRMLKYRNEDVVFYINTILPFGVALAAKLMGKHVIYHIHETSVKPAILKGFLFRIVKLTASDAIYVSNFLLNKEEVKGVESHVVHNALSDEFVSMSKEFYPHQEKDFTILMLSSLKEYKGIDEFVTLAKLMPELNFELVINASQDEIDEYYKDTTLPFNLKIFPTQKNVHDFYRRAQLVLNLSHPLKWVETFGMTALEAMSYGIPVIVPPVGGIAEIIDEGYCGHKIDVRNMDGLVTLIEGLYSNREYYQWLSEGAKEKSTHFVLKNMTSQILKIAS